MTRVGASSARSLQGPPSLVVAVAGLQGVVQGAPYKCSGSGHSTVGRGHGGRQGRVQNSMVQYIEAVHPKRV